MTLSMGTVRWVRSLDTVGTVRWVRRVRYGGYGGRVPLYPPYRTNRTPSPFTHRTTTTFQIGITKTNRSNDFLLKSSVLNGLGPQTVWFNKSGFPNQLVGHWLSCALSRQWSSDRHPLSCPLPPCFGLHLGGLCLSVDFWQVRHITILPSWPTAGNPVIVRPYLNESGARTRFKQRRD